MKYWFYRRFMRWAHRHNWHHVTVCHLENGDVQNWCQWCGLRETLKKDHFAGMKILEDSRMPRNSILLTNIQVPKDY